MLTTPRAIHLHICRRSLAARCPLVSSAGGRSDVEGSVGSDLPAGLHVRKPEAFPVDHLVAAHHGHRHARGKFELKEPLQVLGDLSRISCLVVLGAERGEEEQARDGPSGDRIVHVPHPGTDRVPSSRNAATVLLPKGLSQIPGFALAPVKRLHERIARKSWGLKSFLSQLRSYRTECNQLRRPARSPRRVSA